MSKKKICVLGGGAWGKNHIKTLDKLGALGAIAEKNGDLLSKYKKQYPYVETFKSFYIGILFFILT